MEGLTVGRIVHYVLPSGPSKGDHRPAMVTRVWQPGGCIEGICQLQVFTDGSNDGLANVEWRTSVRHHEPPIGSGEPHELNTWHWPERV